MSPSPTSDEGAAGLAPFIAIVAAASLFGTLPFFARTLSDAGMAAPAIAFARFALTAAFLLPCVVVRGPLRKATLWALAAGAAIAIGWIGFVNSLNWLSVPAAGILFMTFPIFALVMGVVMFAERPTATAIVGAAMIVGAGALAAGGQGGIAEAPWIAILFALAAPAGYAFVLNVVAHKVHGLPPLAVTGTIALGGVIGLTPLLLGLPADALLPTGGAALVTLFVFSAVTAFLPQFVMTLSVPRVGAGRSAVAASVELPATFLTGALLLSEPPTTRHVLAGTIIVAAIVLAGVDQARRANHHYK